MTPQELSRLDYEGASEMLIAYATDAKKYEREISALKAQIDDWKAKANLAQAKNMPDLAQAALQRAAEFDAKSSELGLELAGIRRDIEDLRSALPILRAKQRRIDPDQLLAELSMIVGSDDAQFDAKLAQGDTMDTTGTAQPGAPSSVSGGKSGGNGATDSSQGGPASDPNPTDEAPAQAPHAPQSPSQKDSPAGTSADDALLELKRKMGLL